MHQCFLCGRVYRYARSLNRHLFEKHSLRKFVREKFFEEALFKSLEDYEQWLSSDIESWLRKLSVDVRFQNLRYYATLSATFQREEEFKEYHIVYPMQTILNREFQLQAMFDFFRNQLEEIETQGSGWSLVKVDRINIRVTSFQPLYGGCYVPLPTEIQKHKYSLLNIENTDNRCFLYCILAALFPAKKNITRPGQYKGLEHKINSSTLHFPVSLDQIEVFEYANDLSITVIGYKDKHFFIERESQNRSGTEILLLLYKNHYMLIKKLHSLVGKSNFYFCNKCFRGYQLKSTYLRHVCIKKQVTVFPSEQCLKFIKFQYCEKSCYVGFADFECFISKGKKTTSALWLSLQNF